MSVERVHLIGGAVHSRAVQQIAPALLGVPVSIPEPGEYVALGAARQAAWALSGGHPQWPVTITELPPADDHEGAAEVRDRYAELLSVMYG